MTTTLYLLIKHCCHCGYNGKIGTGKSWFGEGKGMAHYIECPKCGHRGPNCKTEQAALDGWNTLYTEPTDPKIVKDTDIDKAVEESKGKVLEIKP